MSKKSLLEEGTVRRFMKLAGTQVLASDFIEEGTKKGQERETPLQEQDDDLLAAAPEEDVGIEAGEDVDVLEDPEGGLEIEDEVEDEAEEEPEPEELVRRMVDAIADVAQEFGVDVEVGEEEPAELEVGEMGDEEEMGIEAEEDEGAEEEVMTADDEVELQEAQTQYTKKADGTCWETTTNPDRTTKYIRMTHISRCKDTPRARAEKSVGAPQKENLELEEINYIDEDVMMNEVYHRVRKRLLAEKRTDDLASKLAERLSRRLSRRR